MLKSTKRHLNDHFAQQTIHIYIYHSIHVMKLTAAFSEAEKTTALH